MERITSVVVGMMLIASTALAADNLPLDNQKGFAIGVEASTNYLHVVTSPSVETTYTVAMPMALVHASYGASWYSVGLSAGAALPSVRNAFDAMGDANGAASVYGVNAKLVPLKMGPVKLGLVGDIKYIDSVDDSASGSYEDYPTSATLDYGPMVLWSTDAIAQYQACKYAAMFAGLKYLGIAHANATMSARVAVGNHIYENAMDVKLKQVDNFSTVAGMAFMPTEQLSIILQGSYTNDLPVSLAANLEYRF